MSFYIRKALRVGPFRFNLSKSGVGISAGIRGLRLGTGPRGNYVHVGRGGLYFRRSINPAGVSPVTDPQVSAEDADMKEIESGSVHLMVDSSSAELLQEINSKRKKIRIAPFTAIVAIGSVFALYFLGAPNRALAIWVHAAFCLFILASIRDKLRKTTVVFYDLDQDTELLFSRLHEWFSELRKCLGIWHIAAAGAVRDRKHHAGASTLVERDTISPYAGAPGFLKTNIKAPIIPVGKQSLVFMPDRLMVFEPSGVGAVAYSDLRIQIEETRFIEGGSVPPDAQIVDHTLKNVNKRGGPDRRFKDNRQLPVALYQEINFSSSPGLNELIQLSRTDVGSPFVRCVAALADNVPSEPVTTGAIGGTP